MTQPTNYYDVIYPTFADCVPARGKQTIQEEDLFEYLSLQEANTLTEAMQNATSDVYKIADISRRLEDLFFVKFGRDLQKDVLAQLMAGKCCDVTPDCSNSNMYDLACKTGNDMYESSFPSTCRLIEEEIRVLKYKMTNETTQAWPDWEISDQVALLMDVYKLTRIVTPSPFTKYLARLLRFLNNMDQARTKDNVYTALRLYATSPGWPRDFGDQSRKVCSRWYYITHASPRHAQPVCSLRQCKPSMATTLTQTHHTHRHGTAWAHS